MSSFLLEIRCEEIPARMQKGARADLEKLFRSAMKDAGVDVGEMTLWSTPRRLALIVKDLPTQTEAVSEEAKGPPEAAPDQAIDGFCRKNGVTRDQLEVRDVKGRNTYFAVKNIPGRAVAELLAEAIPAIIRAFPWPKSQRWGAASISTESPRWVRPLSGLIALFDGAVINCEIAGINAGNVTLGHRFHSSGDVVISGADDYADALRAAYVIVDHEERQNLIREGAAKAAGDAGLKLVEDEGLVVENAGLTEWPLPLLGRFEDDFLEVPPETIQLTARVNQKYFVCEGSDGKLANAFICTANIEADDGGAAIVDGNRKVLAARLSDARFFWDVDRKKTLAQHAKGLERITFHEKLGTVSDKVERVAKLARWLVEEGIVKPYPVGLAKAGVHSSNSAGGEMDSGLRRNDEDVAQLADQAELAARLCKVDLVTEMVGEFPELQGLMGGYYARAEGLDDVVADAIADHYKPVGQGDDVPTAPVTVAVSLADKLDTLVGFFQIDQKPTGSKDPFALRRAALSILALVFENGLRVEMFDLIAAAAHHGKSGDTGGEIAGFLLDRLKVQQRGAGVRHDLIDAVSALGQSTDNLLMIRRVKALQSFVETEDGTNLLAGYKRASNILKKEEWEAKVMSYAPDPAEKALVDALDAAEPKSADGIAAEDFEAAMSALASLRAPIDIFFEDVTVNDEDAEKRSARLELLARFRRAVHNVADFSKIEG